jgi:hypothetical protein
MTLRDKLLRCPYQQGWTNPNYGRAENLEKIADDYAIEFAEWCVGINIQDYRFKINTTSKKLLEIFKKEKGL